MSAILTRQTKVELSEHSIDLLGRPELQAKYRNASGNEDPELHGVGQTGGVKMWRVDQPKLVDWPDRGRHVFRPQDRYGYFYDEDSYLVLHTYKKQEAEEFSYDIYYWIGRKATQEASEIAAYKSVELDEVLGKRAAQYREVQGHESEGFLALFPTFMVYRGGKSTNWHHPSQRLDKGVQKVYRMWSTLDKILHEVRQYNENGKQTISYELCFDDLEIEQGGIYAYDSHDKLWLFCTKASGAWDRYHVGKMVMHIGYSRLGFYNNFGHYDEDTPGDSTFMDIVGVKTVTPLHSRVYDHSVGPPARLYLLSETDPNPVFTLIEPPFTRSSLSSSEIYVLDDYGNAQYPVVYVWVGKDVSDSKTRFALAHGEVYLQDKRGREEQPISLSVTVVRIREGWETSYFLRALGSDEA